MRTPFVSLAALTLTLAACGGSRGTTPNETENIFGPDNRETVTGQPYDAVGRIDSGCTGTLIGQRLVLTAAHCVIDSATGTVKPDLKFFRPALANGTSSAPTWIDFAWVGSTTPETDRINDWAIVRLDTAIGAQFSHMGVHVVDFAAALPYTTNLVGYSSDRNQGNDMAIHRGCYVHEIVEGKLYHDCDGASGISGAPLVNVINGNTYVVGITVSEFRQGAPDSVHRDGYSRDYANVAVPASGFDVTVTALLQTADVGVAAPTIAGVTALANPNLRSTDPVTPTDPTNPTNPGGLHTADDIVDASVFVGRANELSSLFGRLADEVRALDAMAFNARDTRLQGTVQALAQASREYENAVRDTATGRSGADYQSYVYDGWNGTQARFTALARYDLSGFDANRGGAIQQSRARIAQLFNAIEAVIFR